MNPNHYVVIMAGGIGSRFWPVSRQKLPKQFIDIMGTGKSLIAQTHERFSKIVAPKNIYIVTNNEYVGMVQDHIPGISLDNILAEPTPRNTAPCVALASHKIKSINPNGVCIIAPSDHLILEESAFHKQVMKAFGYAENSDMLITFGIEPSRPDTGYGYIQKQAKGKHEDLYAVKTFTEKPTEEIAMEFIETGEFLWNAGIFCWSIKTILNRFEEFLPEMQDSFSQIDFNSPQCESEIVKTYETCQSISLDYGILEKDKNVFVLPSSFGWSDLGTWKSLWEVLPKENSNSSVTDKKFISDSKDNLVFSKNNKMVVLHGVNNLVVVEDDDVILVMDKNREQELRKVVNEIKKNNPGQYD